jgi:DNA-binding transcriptional MocR family regulator
VVTTSGAIEAMTLALRAVANPGDAVLVESPGYFGIHQAIRVLGYQVFEAPCDPVLGLEPARLEQAIRRAGKKLKAAVIVATHHNPLGVSIPEPARKEILQIALKHGVTVIEDDIYGDLSYSQPRPRPLKALDRQENVILCGSFSKTAAPGLRVGYVISQKHAARISAMRSALASGVSTLAEETLGLYLQSGSFDRHLRKVSREYETLTRLFSVEIERNFPEGTRMSRPTGGYLLWVQLPAGTDARKVQARALERKISVTAGSLFSPQGAYLDCLRINCALPWTQGIERAIRELGKISDALSRSL